MPYQISKDGVGENMDEKIEWTIHIEPYSDAIEQRVQQQGNDCQEKHPQSGIDYSFHLVRKLQFNYSWTLVDLKKHWIFPVFSFSG